MKRFLIAASVVAGAVALGSPCVKAESNAYFNPEYNSSWSGSKATGTSLDLHVGYESGPFFIQGGPALQNDTLDNEWGLTGKAGLSGDLTKSTSMYAEIGAGKFDDSDLAGYMKIGSKTKF